jgi:RNA polymerase sigma-70 factor (ECF subfamily)
MMDSGTSPAEEIIARARTGRADALDSLLELHGEEIQAVAYSVARDHYAAEDITAETIITAWQRIGSLRDPARLRTWMLRIATRQALQYLRRARRTQRGSLGENDQAADGFEADVVDRLAIEEAISQLPPRMRVVIALHYVADLSIDTISEVTGRSRNTVKSELRLGLQRLRAKFPEGRSD